MSSASSTLTPTASSVRSAAETASSTAATTVKRTSKRLRTKQWWSLFTPLQGFPLISILLMVWLYKSPLSRHYLGRRFERGIFFIYMFWMIFFDNHTPTHGGRPSHWLRNLRFWKHFRNYFPHNVIHQGTHININQLEKPNQNVDQAVPLTSPSSTPFVDPAKGPYIIGVHPHGIVGVYIPFWRDLLMGCALIDASRSSIKYCLNHGISVAIVVGGAQEALDARPGTADLTLSSRLGFIRIAIEHGASLVPVFSFGENDVYEPVVYNAPGSIGRRIQDTLKDYMGFSLPLVTGRTGNPLLPRRRPLTTVIGKPIAVAKVAKPRLRDILMVHQQYVTALQAIYDDYKDVLDPQRKDELRIVDELKDRDMRRFPATKETLESFKKQKRSRL